MTSSDNNPFVFPGFSSQTDGQQNPVAASVEMMQQMWQQMAGVGQAAQHELGQPLTVEELDRRIAQLKTIENWLQLNLSMISSTSQALQVQRSTIATLKSFMGLAGSHSDTDNPSPLEVAFGLKPAGQAKIKPASEDDSSANSKPEQKADEIPNPMPGMSSAHDWWNLLQQQFNALATATAASMQAAQPADQAPTNNPNTKTKESQSPSDDKSSAGARATKKPTKAARKTAAKRASGPRSA